MVALAFAAVGSALALTRVMAGRHLAVTWHRVPWHGSRRVRVVHLTDVHAGPSTPRAHLAKIARTVEALHGDVVVMTGDYVNMSLVYLDRVTELVRALPGPCVATLGNHDHWTSAARVAEALEAGGATVLRNASTVVGAPDAPLVVVGVDDGCTRNDDVARAFAGVARPDRALVLSHFPSTAERIARTGAPLVLSGHTHAGHVDVGRLTDRVARLAGNPYLHGFHRVGERTDLYVSAGIGHALPGLRAGRATAEIAVFELDPAAATRSSRALRLA